MIEEAIRHRLSMAAFYEAEQLWTAVVELLAGGLSIEQQCCAGRAEAMQQVSPPRHVSWELSTRLWALVRCVEPYVLPDDPNNIVASSGEVLKILVHACPARGGPNPATAAVQQETVGPRNGSCKALRKHMDAGAVLLIVSAESASQQVASSRVMLRNSPIGVQTFEFTGSAMQ